jgi:hypothetical protein
VARVVKEEEGGEEEPTGDVEPVGEGATEV